VPECWQPSVRLRPEMERAVRVGCWGATSARLVTPPAHSDVTNVSADWYGLSFDARPHDHAPRFDEAVFEITGHTGSIEQRVRIEVVPTEENSPPVCDGDRVSARSDGTGPVDVFLHPYCRDPDGDDFVIEGGPPGVHPQSPKRVPAGSGESNWPYRTATFSGEETTTIWATDSLGARSADAELKITVGPGVDRLPQCTPSSYTFTDVYTVDTRPGQTRRFGLICTDPDGDLFASRLSRPPQRGALALAEGPPRYGWFGVERWSDATYVPVDDSLEPDPFSVTATGLGGDGPEGRMVLVPRPLPYNSGGACGYGPAEVLSPGPGVLRAGCEDNEGDPLSAEIIVQPKHGTVTPAVVTPTLNGWNTITIPYLPDPGYEGYDCVEIRVTDGHGLEFKIPIDIWVRPPLQVEPPELPELPDPPVVPDLPAVPDPPTLPDVPVSHLPPDVPVLTFPTAPPDPGEPAETGLPAGQPPPITPVVLPGRPSSKPVRPLVERILGTRAVRRVHAARGAQVWARSKLSRRSLLRRGQAPGVVVVCSARCRVRADAVLAAGLAPIPSSRQTTLAEVAAGEPQVLSLTLGEAERQALRRLRKPRARFRLSIRRNGAPATSLKRSIPISG
jgi:hypothetical protein